jgi:hypothetical protein
MYVKLKFERILDTVIGSLIRNTPYVYSSDILLETAIRQWMWIGGFPRLVAKEFIIYLNIQRLQHYSTLIGHCTLWDNGIVLEKPQNNMSLMIKKEAWG